MQIISLRGITGAVGLCVLASGAQAQLAPAFSNASLRGQYTVQLFRFDTGSAEPLWPAGGINTIPFSATALPTPVGFQSVYGTAIFDGAGNLTVSYTKNQDGTITTATNLTATYSVAANGIVTATGSQCCVFTGTLVEDGKMIVGIPGDSMGSLLFVKKRGSSDNVADGPNVMEANTTGIENAAMGAYALAANTTGSGNAGYGYQALYANTSGGNNTAFGRAALSANTTGFGNAAQGFNALVANTTGYRNTAIGNDALQTNVAGIYNTAVGFQAGVNITGSYNIDIGNTGLATDHNTIRIGATTSVPGDSANNVITATYIAGIFGNGGSGGSAVYVDTYGHLFTNNSSERFKTGVAHMPDLSERLAQLRPVTFRYKSDPAGIVQYGLIAEEVDKVYPELVIRDDAGRIQGVRYEELAPMLLNEAQQQATKLAALEQKLAEVDALKEQLAALIQELGGRDHSVAPH